MPTLPKKMKANVFYEKEKLKLEELPVPKVGDDEILVRVKACGMCGSDLAYFFGKSSLGTPTGKGPLVLGHEFTGQVVRVGKVPAKLKCFAEGDRVVINPVQHCNACAVCAKGYVNLCQNMSVVGVSVNGGYAEYCVSKYTGAIKLPNKVSYEEGALTEPLACATYAVKNLQVEPGNFVVVFGPGPIGLMVIQLLKAAGAGKIALVGTRDYRLEEGKKFGANILFNTADPKSKYYVKNLAEAVGDLTGGMFADRAITTTGSSTACEQALEVTGRRSVIVFFGLPADTAKISVPALQSIFFDKTIRFSWLAPLTWPTAIDSIANGLVDAKALITHKYPLPKLEEALRSLSARKGNVIKALITP